MGKCCSVDRNELPDENIQIIRMKMPKPQLIGLKKPNLDDLNTNIQEKNINSDVNTSPMKYNKSFSPEKDPAKFNYSQKLEDHDSIDKKELNEENNEQNYNDFSKYEEEDLNKIPDQDIRMHVFS